MLELERDNPDSSESQWIGSLSVTDVDAAAQLFQSRGGTVLGGPADVDRRGRVAVVSDPQGAVLALVRTEDGDPPEREPGMDDWLWQELWTTDGPTALTFYRDMAGYSAETVEVEAGAYHVLQRDGQSYAGLAQLPWDSVPPRWLPYVRVDDARLVAGRVEALGGRVVLSPDQIRRGTAAVIEDPTGGILAVQQWPPSDVEPESGGGR
jgi:predicted enzyme related to lactoylglutathione lyase